jgi:hypothetical protein
MYSSMLISCNDNGNRLIFEIWWNFFYDLFLLRMLLMLIAHDPELESLSDWVRTIRSLVQGRIHKLKNCVNSRPKSVFKGQEAMIFRSPVITCPDGLY